MKYTKLDKIEMVVNAVWIITAVACYLGMALVVTDIAGRFLKLIF